jgi:peptidoglycan hydrolase-like protein with peptidoglycan-binding domain
MNRLFRVTSVGMLCAVTLSVSGCAGARLNKDKTAVQKPLKPAEQIALLESESKAKDQEIRRLQMEMAAMKNQAQTAPPMRQISYEDTYTYQPATNVVSTPKVPAGRVAGVTTAEIQRALKKAGYDPGPADGRLGKRTKQAILDFQRAKGLKADGVVGKKTWAALKSAS